MRCPMLHAEPIFEKKKNEFSCLRVQKYSVIFETTKSKPQKALLTGISMT